MVLVKRHITCWDAWWGFYRLESISTKNTQSEIHVSEQDLSNIVSIKNTNTSQPKAIEHQC